MALQNQSLSFFNFEDLPSEECQLVLGILKGNNAGKAPELPWRTDNLNEVRYEEQPVDLPLLQNGQQLPAMHTAPVNPLSAQHGPPMYSAAVQPNQLTMHPTHMLPSFTPQGLVLGPHAPLPYVTMVTGTDAHSLPMLSHHIPHVVPVTTMVTTGPVNHIHNLYNDNIDSKNAETDASVKVRRNKKKRPPDYYARLEARESTPSEDGDGVASYVATQQSVPPVNMVHLQPVTNRSSHHSIIDSTSVPDQTLQHTPVSVNYPMPASATPVIATTQEAGYRPHVESSLSSQIYTDASRTESNVVDTAGVVSPSSTDNISVGQDISSTPASGENDSQSYQDDEVVESVVEEITNTDRDVPNVSVNPGVEECVAVSGGNAAAAAALDTCVPAGDVSSEMPNEPTSPQPLPSPPLSSPSTQDKPKVSSWAGLFKPSHAPVVYGTGSFSLSGSSSDSKTSGGRNDDVKKASREPNASSTVSMDKDSRNLPTLLKNLRLSHRSVSLQPRGLTNRSNWCYVNATLQALLACPPFYHLFRSLPSFPALSRSPSASPIMDSMVEFMNEFTPMQYRPLEKAALNGKGTVRQDIQTGPVFEPANVYKMLQTIKYDAAFKQGRQEDAEEFLSCLLNGLHDEMVACMKQDASGDGSVSNGDVVEEEVEVDGEGGDDEEESGWEQVGPRNRSVITRSTKFDDSPISEMMRGQIRSVLHKAGSKESATLEPFFTLQLDVQSKAVSTVEQALEGLVCKETLHGYTCSKTKQEVDASRRYLLEELPPVLMLHLKWFTYDKSGGIQKNVRQVDFNIDLEINKELLSPMSRCRSNASYRKYKLFAVVSHLGGRAVGGHYITDVFHPGINGWVRCDDSNVFTVPINRVVKFVSPKVPYLLYYRRLDLS